MQARLVTAFAKEHDATIAILGPEAPLAAGVADALWSAGVPVVGPTQSLARIESSKSFARELLAKYQIQGNPFFQRFESLTGLEQVLERYPNQHVIKDDGLAGGKGVKVCGDHLHSLKDSVAFCCELVQQGHPFVVEEKIEGEEFSLMSFCDGETLRHMPAVQDHKRAYENDKGPNMIEHAIIDSESRALVATRFEVFAELASAFLRHRPTAADCPIELLATAGTAPLATSRWRAVGGRVTMHPVPGDHYSMLQQPHLGSVAAVLDRLLS